MAVLLTPTLLPRLSFADSGHPDAGVIRGPADIRKCNSKVALVFRAAVWFPQMAQREELGHVGKEMRRALQNHPPNSLPIP